MSDKKIDDGNLKDIAGGGADSDLQADPNAPEVQPAGETADPPAGGGPGPESEGGGGGNQDLQI